jgi:hypothetical protein
MKQELVPKIKVFIRIGGVSKMKSPIGIEINFLLRRTQATKSQN